MLKSPSSKTSAPAPEPVQTADAAAEQELVRHRTAIRIVGIEGIEVFADQAEPADAQTIPSQPR